MGWNGTPQQIPYFVEHVARGLAACSHCESLRASCPWSAARFQGVLNAAFRWRNEDVHRRKTRLYVGFCRWFLPKFNQHA